MGGGMRQAGLLAAACLYALENNVDKLLEDHRRAKDLANELQNLEYVSRVFPVETNIVLFELKDSHPINAFLLLLSKKWPSREGHYLSTICIANIDQGTKLVSSSGLRIPVSRM